MNVKVEIVLTATPKERHLSVMRSAADGLTNDTKTVNVSVLASNPLVQG